MLLGQFYYQLFTIFLRKGFARTKSTKKTKSTKCTKGTKSKKSTKKHHKHHKHLKHQKHKKAQKAQKRNQVKAQNGNKRTKTKNALEKHLSRKL